MQDALWTRWAATSHRHAGKLVVLGLLLWAVALPHAVALYTHLHTDLRELLPQGAPGAIALDELERRVGGQASLTVVVKAPNRAVGQRFVDALAARLRTLPPAIVSRVDADVRQETAFVQAHGALYANTADLQAIADGLTQVRATMRRAANPLHVDLEDAPARSGDPRAIENAMIRAIEELRKQATEATPFAQGYLASPDGKTLIVNIKPAKAAVDLVEAQRIFAAVYSAVTAVQADEPMVKVGYTGEVRGLIEAQEHLMRDLWTTSVVVLVAVSCALLLYFGHLRSLPLLVGPLLVGTTAAFALARIAVPYLNPNTAFLGSIIVGNGINAGIVLLSRFDEERRAGAEETKAWATALATTWRGTLTASGAAALGYGVLATMQFRGFNQFGIIGGIGMATCWWTTYALLPPLSCLLHRRWPQRYGMWSQPWPWTRTLVNLLARHPRQVLVTALIVVAVSVMGAARFARSPLEHDLQQLTSAQSQVDGEVYWSHEVDAVMRQYQTPTVVLTRTAAEAEQVASALRQVQQREGARTTLAKVATLQDFLPQDQARRLQLVAQILDLARPATGAMGQVDPLLLRRLQPDVRDELSKLAAAIQLTAVQPRDLPPRWGDVFFEKTGDCQGCIVVVYPTMATDASHGEAQAAHAAVIRQTVAQTAPQAHVAGTLVLVADIQRAVTEDGRGATLLSLLAVTLATLLVLRSARAAGWVIGALLLGVLWMVGAFGWLHIRLNFVNFAALPITFGVGVDYAVNYVQRARQVGDAAKALTSIGGAVLLCSATTVLGYATLLLADNLAVRSFGRAAVIGELTCLSAALLVTPALYTWLDNRNGDRS